MDLDRLIVILARALAALVGILGGLSIRAGERIKAWQQSRGQAPTQCQSMRAAAGVPAAGAVVAPLPVVQPAAIAAVTAPMAAAPPPVATISPAATPPVSVESEPASPPDELDWAGSLNHAAVAGLHLEHVLAMVRAGWLVSEGDHLDDVCAAFDAMEAFLDRTNSAIAPVLAAMTDEQRAEFFADFGGDFPPDLPELDTQGQA